MGLGAATHIVPRAIVRYSNAVKGLFFITAMHTCEAIKNSKHICISAMYLAVYLKYYFK